MNRVLRFVAHPVTILAAALLVRIAFVLSMGNRFYFADTQEYEATALRLLAGHGPDEHSPRAPLFPAFMALGFAIGGAKNYLAVRLLQAVVSTAIVALTMRLAWRLAGRGAMVVSGVFMAFGPLYVFTSGMLYPVTLYSLMLMGVAKAALRLDHAPGARAAVVMGAAMLFGWLTDQVMVAPIAVVLIWLAWPTGRAIGRRLAFVALAVALFVAGMAAFVSTQRQAYGGKAIFMSKAQYVLHYARSDSTLATHRRVRFPAGSVHVPLGASAFVLREIGLLQRQPLDYVSDVAREFVHFFQPLPDRIQTKNQYNQPAVLWVGVVHFLPVLLLAIVGAFSRRAPLRRRLLLVGVVVGTAAFYSLFFTQTRYRVPVEPFLVALAGVGFATLFPRVAVWLGGEVEPARAVGNPRP